MPATWAVVGRDENGTGGSDPFDPADAIPAMARYDCQLLAAITHAGIPGDQIDLMLAAYNAGLAAVLHYHGIPPTRKPAPTSTASAPSSRTTPTPPAGLPPPHCPGSG